MRLFVGLSLPQDAIEALSALQHGLEGARWRPAENFHITLAFIGETDRHGFHEASGALQTVDAPGFSLRLSGAGSFGERKPRAVWAGVAPGDEIHYLQARIAAALRRAGLAVEKRKFTPHVTLAYLKNARREAVASYCAMHGLFSTREFPVAQFHLYSSKMGGEASHYTIENSYPLSSSM